MSDSVLVIRHLTKSVYAGVPGCCARVRVLDDLDLRVSPGEIVLVVGAAGSGKTTLLRCVAGSLTPDRGVIEVDAHRVLLVDEPMGRAGTIADALIRDLRRAADAGRGVLVASRTAELARAATRVLYLDRGRWRAETRGGDASMLHVAEGPALPLTPLPAGPSIR